MEIDGAYTYSYILPFYKHPDQLYQFVKFNVTTPKKYNWQYKTLINRQSEEENSIVSLEVSHDQFIGFIFDGDISPSFACNSPDKNKYKKLVA